MAKTGSQAVTDLSDGLRVGNKWLLKSDGLNIIVQERKKNKTKGTYYWCSVAYFATFAAALSYLVEHEVKQVDLADYKALCDKIAAIHKEVRMALGTKGVSDVR